MNSIHNFQPYQPAEELPADTLHVHIINSIRQMIRDGVLNEGDALPSERDLAVHFGVSRVPVREAIRTMEFIGVLQRVRSKGLIVKQVDLRHTLNQFQFLFANTPAALDELFEVRLAIEVQSAIAAASNWTDTDLLRIEEQWLIADHYIRLGHDAFEPAAAFHYAIAQATHNATLIRIFDFLGDLRLFAAQTNLNLRTGRLLTAHAEHQHIYECIKNRDPEAAGQAMRKHLDNSSRTSREQTTS